MTTAAVVGIGDISTIHLQAIAETNQIDLVGVCDSVPERADRAAQEWGVPAFTDHQSLLRQARPQVLHITLPHYLHVPVALDALAAGSHVLTEKPLSHTYQSAQRLAEVARDWGSASRTGTTRPRWRCARPWSAAGTGRCGGPGQRSGGSATRPTTSGPRGGAAGIKAAVGC